MKNKITRTIGKEYWYFDGGMKPRQDVLRDIVADYKVYADPERQKCIEWEHKNRDKYPRELWLEKITY